METQATPRPWTLGHNFISPASTRCLILAGPRGSSIAFVNIWEDDEPAGRANAALMIRAVNHHDALVGALAAQGSVRSDREWHAHGCIDTIRPPCASHCQQARDILAAIRKEAP